MTDTLSLIKSQINFLFMKNEKIHVDLSYRGERKHPANITAVITGVYPNIFTIRLTEEAVKRNYAFKYVDLMTHNIEIRELKELG